MWGGEGALKPPGLPLCIFTVQENLPPESVHHLCPAEVGAGTLSPPNLTEVHGNGGAPSATQVVTHLCESLQAQAGAKEAYALGQLTRLSGLRPSRDSLFRGGRELGLHSASRQLHTSVKAVLGYLLVRKGL